MSYSSKPVVTTADIEQAIRDLSDEVAALREENRNLREAWPASGEHVIYRCASGKFFMFGDDTLYDTRDEAINVVAGIETQSSGPTQN